MNIKPVASPHEIAQPTPRPDAKQRAVQAFMTAGQPQQEQAPRNPANPTGIRNTSQVAPEEMLAITDNVQEPGMIEETEELQPEEPVVETPPKADPLSSQYAILARKEKALRAKTQQMELTIKTREAALQAKEDALKAKEQEYSTNYVPKSRFQQNPIGALEEVGLSYDQITQAQIDAVNVNPQVSAHIQRLEAKLAQLEAKAEASDKYQQDQQTTSYQAAVKQITADAKKLVFTDPNFETVKATNSVKDVVELIEQHFKETGDVMSVEESAEEVENHLLEEIDKLNKIEKIKKRREAMNASGTPPRTQTPSPNKQPQQMKTLTNASSSTRTLSAKERAILAFKGELKS